MNAYALLLATMAPAPGGGTSPLVPILIQFSLIFGIFYLILIRPQQKQRRSHEEALRNLKKGDEVVTAGGIIGEVLHIATTQAAADEKAKGRNMEDRVTIKSADSRMIVERGRISRISNRDSETSAP